MTERIQSLRDASCQFCREFETGVLEFSDERIKRTILTQTGDIVLFPALGSLARGHLLLSTHNHYRNLSHTPHETLALAERVLFATGNTLRERYQRQIVLFEHGSNAQGEDVSCIEHTHVHIVPTNAPALEYARTHRDMRPLARLQDIRAYALQSYLFVSDGNQHGVIAPAQGLCTQFWRRFIASHEGIAEEWDWFVYPRIALMRETMNDLRKTLEKISRNIGSAYELK